jgi:phosphopantetheinyl transferase
VVIGATAEPLHPRARGFFVGALALDQLPAWVQAAAAQPSQPLVFLMDCDVPCKRQAQLQASLDDGECAALQRLQSEKERQRQAAIRGVLRQLLGALLRLPAGEVSIRRREGRPPELAAAHAASCLRFSTSRVGALGAIALAQGSRLGVDIEPCDSRRHPVTLAGDVLTPAELEMFARVPDDQRSRWLMHAWVCKEALLKGVGTGLQIDPTRVGVMPVQWTRESVPPRWGTSEAIGMPEWPILLLEQHNHALAVAVQAQCPHIGLVELSL